MNKKNISIKTAVKGLINGFLSYGILIIFLFLALVVFVSWKINQYKEFVDYDTLKYSLPILASFLIFFLIRSICRLSTYDLFLKCKISKKDVNKVSSRMNLFFIGCVAFSVIFILVVLTVKFNNQKTNIQQTTQIYQSQYSQSFADYLTLEMISDFQNERATTLIQVTIIEIGLLCGLFSLISAQKKLIEKYNFIDKNKEEEQIGKLLNL